MDKLKDFVNDLLYIFLNYFVNNIPSWYIRKFVYVLFGMKIGKNSRIKMKCTILMPWNITIGDNTIINEYCYIDGRGTLKIGNNVSISIYSIILTASHISNSSTFLYKKESVNIEDNVWIGARATVLEGSCISTSTILAAGSTFKGITEENYIYSGIPAMKRKFRGIKEFKLDKKTVYFR